MSNKSIGKVLCLVGAVLMGHSAFAMIQFRHYVRASGDEQIIVEALLALALCMVGASWWAGNYKKILAAPTMWSRRYDYYSQVEDFQIFTHRGKAFAQWGVYSENPAASAGKGRAQKSQASVSDENKMD